MTNIRNHPHIEMQSPRALIPSPTNARKHPKKQIEALKRSISRFGFLVPIVCEGQLIVSGHGRWEAATALNLDAVPTINASFMTEADRRAFALATNRLADMSEWDEDKLKTELNFLFEDDYDLTYTGFDTADLDLMTLGDEPEPPVALPSDDEVAISRLGDVWHLGDRHRLMCGTSRKRASFEELLGDERATMVLTDPPYNVPIGGHVSGLGKVQHREFAEASGEMTQPEYVSFLRDYMRQAVAFSVNGSIHYHFIDWRHLRDLQEASDGIYAEFKQLLVWDKGSGSMGGFYRSRHELVAVFKAGTARHINHAGLSGKGARYRTNVLEHPGANTFRRGGKADLKAHPTVKPVGLYADLMLDCSDRGDLILDPFAGSGTIFLSAEATGRRAAAIEIDPLHVDTAIRRFREATGAAVLLADGRSFDELAAARAEEAVDGH